jgi:hypothetical protein
MIGAPIDNKEYRFREHTPPLMAGFLTPDDLRDGALERAVAAAQQIRKLADAKPDAPWLRVPRGENDAVADAMTDAWMLGLLTMVIATHRATGRQTSLVRPALLN